MANNKQQEEMKKFGVVGALIGAIIGGILAIVFSDEKNRKKFLQGLNSMKDEAIDIVEETPVESSPKKLAKSNKKSK